MYPVSYAVTGTNGKTSTTHLLYQLWDMPSALLGNLGLVSSPSLTLPDTLSQYPLAYRQTSFEPLLKALQEEGIQRFTFEAFSLMMKSKKMITTIPLQGAAFTNLSPDHMEHHKTMEQYFAAKSELFLTYLPKDKTKVIYADCPYGQRLIETFQGKNCIRYGKSDAYDLWYDDKYLYFDQKRFPIAEVPFFGEPMIQNLLCSIGLALADGMSSSRLCDKIPSLWLPKRRQEKLYDGDITVYVDYAHNPGAVQEMLPNMRKLSRKRLIVLLDLNGYKGRRKQEIKLEMAEIGYREADYVAFTCEELDPGYQNQIQEACPKAPFFRYREDAIRHVILEAKAGDIVVLTKSGKMTELFFRDDIVPYNEYAAVEKAIAIRKRLGEA